MTLTAEVRAPHWVVAGWRAVPFRSACVEICWPVSAASPEAAQAAAALPEVAQSIDVIARTDAALGVNGVILRVELIRAPARDRILIDRPVVVSGRWLSGDMEIVIESTMADHLGIKPGDQVEAGGRTSRRLRVVGSRTRQDGSRRIHL